MRRRQLLRASAAAVGGGGAALAGVRLSGDAGAQTALTLSTTGDGVTLGTDDSVTGVRLDADIDWAYDLPDGARPETVVVELAAGTDSVSVVASAESAQLFTDATGSESFDVGLVSEGVLDAATLAPEAGERVTEVIVEARLRVEGASGVLARETARETASLTVGRDGVNASAYGSVGGEAGLTIETDGE